MLTQWQWATDHTANNLKLRGFCNDKTISNELVANVITIIWYGMLATNHVCKTWSTVVVPHLLVNDASTMTWSECITSSSLHKEKQGLDIDGMIPLSVAKHASSTPQCCKCVRFFLCLWIGVNNYITHSAATPLSSWLLHCQPIHHHFVMVTW